MPKIKKLKKDSIIEGLRAPIQNEYPKKINIKRTKQMKLSALNFWLK